MSCRRDIAERVIGAAARNTALVPVLERVGFDGDVLDRDLRAAYKIVAAGAARVANAVRGIPSHPRLNCLRESLCF